MIRFVPPSNLFGTPRENPDNACFCNNPDGICDTPSGVFNVSACQFGSPTLLSWPHFFQADPSLRAAVNGMKPDKNKHQFYIDVQPVDKFFSHKLLALFLSILQKLGSGLSGKIRSQVNIKMSKIDGVEAAKGLRDIIVPLIWFSDDLEKITDQQFISRIKEML